MDYYCNIIESHVCQFYFFSSDTNPFNQNMFFTAEKDLHSIVEWWISSCWGPHEDQVSRTSQPENVAIVPYVWHSLAIFYGEISLALT